MSEQNGGLPSGWVHVRLEEVGMTPTTTVDPSKEPNKEWELWSVPSFPTGRPEVLMGAQIGSTKQSVHEGDVLLCKINPRINRVWVVGKANGLEQIASSEWIVFRRTEVDPRFLMHRLREGKFREELCAEVSGVGGSLTRARPQTVKTLRISLPPLAEQRRIVAKIEVLQDRSRQAREALAEVGPLLEQFRQSVLAASFRGDLTADWRAAHPNVEPASELLHRIRAEGRRRWEQAELAKYEAKGQERPKNWQDKYEEPEPIDDTDLPELPEGWCWTRLPDLGYMNRGKSRHRPRNAAHLYGGPYPFVQTGDIAQSRGRIMSHKQTYSEAGLAQSNLWPEGTVCITIAANIASSAVLSYPACFPDSIVGLLPDESLCSSEFVEFFIRTAKDDLERFAPSTAQKNINLETLSELAVPLPPLEESKEITRLLTELIDGAFHIDEAVASLIERIDQFDQSILAKAFRGELVPQDPGDEPASVLLERIRTQRKQQAEATEKTSRIQRRNKMEKKSSGLTSQRRPLVDVLTAKGQPMAPEQLLTEAGYDDGSIEDFYLALREEIENGHIREDRPSEGNVMLEAAEQ